MNNGKLQSFYVTVEVIVKLHKYANKYKEHC